MSIHPSLRTGDKTGALRNVQKRHERVRDMMSKGEWEDGRAVFGLPKQKIVKIKAKKAEEKPKEEGAADAPAGAADAAAKPAA